MTTIEPRFGPGSRILVAGGAGFVPSHVVDRLLDRGASVVVVDNFITGTKENVAQHEDDPRFTLVEADVSEPLPAGVPALASVRMEQISAVIVAEQGNPAVV